MCIGAFTIQPTSVVQAESVEARFFCQNQGALFLTWSIGGVLLSNYHPLNVVEELEEQTQISILRIPALVRHNGTAIQCKAIFSVHLSELSQKAYLTIQSMRTCS